MKLVDAHCHLESSEFSGRLDKIIADARKAGIVKLITSSITPGEWDLSESIARKYPEVEFALGIHPWYVKPEDTRSVPMLYNAGERGAVAIGEIGLDNKTQKVPMELQLRLFEMQLMAACEINLPIIIHCRGAFELMHSMIKKVGLPKSGGIIHNFSGSAEIALEYIKFGMSFSFGGVLTYRNSKKKEAVLKEVFPGNFLLETDSPDIPPVEAGKGTNVPANMLYNLKAASEILNIKESVVAEASTANAARIFNLKI